MEMINWKDLLYPYQQTMDELLIKFRNLDAEYRYLGLYSPIDGVTGRVKSITSILEKANRKQIPADRIAEEIEDIAGGAVVNGQCVNIDIRLIADDIV